MRARATLLILAVAVAGCTSANGTPLPPGCTSEPADVARARADAPGEVRLEGGTPLSFCVRNARGEADLQNLGLVLTGVAEDLEAEARTTPRSALELGYLIGAARRGAPSESSLQAELVRRLERSAAIRLPPEGERALAEGMEAGEARG